jgi:chorismate--pyruvate lyase
LTLFSGEVPVARGGLEYAVPPPGHPLDALTEDFAGPSAGLPARRCRFELVGAPLVVCEVFLPGLEYSLADIGRCRVA